MPDYNYSRRKQSVGRYLRNHTGIPLLDVDHNGVLTADGMSGYVMTNRMHFRWQEQLIAHADDVQPFFVVVASRDQTLEDSRAHIGLRHLAVLLDGYHRAVVLPRMQGKE